MDRSQPLVETLFLTVQLAEHIVVTLASLLMVPTVMITRVAKHLMNFHAVTASVDRRASGARLVWRRSLAVVTDRPVVG